MSVELNCKYCIYRSAYLHVLRKLLMKMKKIGKIVKMAETAKAE